MRRLLRFPALLIMLCSILLPEFLSAQQQTGFKSDAELIALANKFLQSQITKTVRSNGDVYLQRDMTAYLHTNLVPAPPVDPVDEDHGHDHKDAMLRTFLNRPHPDVATMEKYFNAAAVEFNVPVGILKATAQVQSNWAQVSESMYGSWGVMGLIENPFTQQLSKAASLLHTGMDAIKNDAKTNIRAAAALLAYYQQRYPTATSEAGWFKAVKDLTGLTDEQLRTDLAARIYQVLQQGSKTVTLWREIIYLAPANVILPPSATNLEKMDLPNTSSSVQATDYPNAIPNFTTCNYNSRPAGSGINYYFVHYVATGTYQGAINWFKDCSSSVSAHYVIRNSDGQISQVVAEASRAWSQGVTAYNDQGIGVEHEVLATNLSMWDSEPMLNAGASLAADACNRWGIPKTRRVTNGDRGIYGHSDVRATDCPNLTQPRWDILLAKIATATASVGTPTLYSIANSGSGTQVMATWKANTEPTLLGYRLYYANNDSLNSWSLVANETTLTPAITTVTLTANQFLVPPAGDVHHFKLTAVVSDGPNPNVESAGSDIYSRSSNVTGPKVLIVDAFDRINGSYTAATHPFVTSYFKAMRNKGLLQISSVANEKIEDGSFLLNNYDIVVWFMGDESSLNVVFSAAEKTAISNYLSNGGKLLLSGSETAYNIGRSGAGAYDLSFMNNYLKSNYVADGSITYTPATGIAGTPFEGLTIPFGVVYTEDFPDAINAVTGATNILNYSDATKKAGVVYKGIFGSGTVDGALIFLSFTLETAVDADITTFMQKALPYFDVAPLATPPTAVADNAVTQSGLTKRINVLMNDIDNGTPLNPATVSIFSTPANGTVSIDASGNISYTSTAGFTGSNQFQYQVQNTSGQFSNAATVTVTVQAASSCDPDAPETDDLHPKRDLRGAWVSTVSNIDWPSSRSLSSSQQQAELLKILDTLSRTGINTIFLQVRPESDALYASAIDPWSYWLTNAQGTAPSPLWDPLAFAIDAAHARGMELHAWINPYRAKQSTPVLAPNHVANLHPDWTFISGSATLLNPGLPDVRNYLTTVIADIATRYNVDGIHFDDYFYPYAGMTGQDNATYTNYNPTGIATIEDWRRNNVNTLIAMVYDTINFINTAGNRNILFGVSPFGIWKSGVPAGISGTSSYSQVYCDPIAWLQAGKVDYVAPQLYWKITGAQDYNALSKWWNDQGALYGRHIYPGLALYKMADANNWAASEIENQISINRGMSHQQVKGQVMFSTKQIMTNVKGIKTALQNNQYSARSFSPAMPWKDAICPNPPVNFRQDADTLRWDAPAAAADGDLAKKYVVYRFNSQAEAATNMNDGKKVYAITYTNKIGVPLPEAINSYFTVTALDDNNNESIQALGTVLPVTGLQLEVELSGNTAQLHWRTLTETKIKHFEIERSIDGRSFYLIGTATAAGNSNGMRKYQRTDFLTTAGAYYYRIRSVDFDGNSNYSNIRRINYQSAETYVVGPNPFSHILNISNLSGANKLEIIDMAGRILLTKKIDQHQFLQLNTENIPAGVYHLRIGKVNGEFKIVKLVKQ